MRSTALIVALAACASPPRYLGAEVPRACEVRDVESCLGWMMERDLHAAELGLYDDPALRAYVQRVVDRLAAAAAVPAPPRVLVAQSDETYATAGRRIVIARTTLERLDTEAELAAVLAHELVHLEARHVMVSLFGRPETESAADRRDAEAIADERAVWLLERAGYSPSAMVTALDAVLDVDGADHPPRAERLARVEQLAGGRTGFDGRAEYLEAIEQMLVGRDPRLGERVGDAWIVSRLGIAVELDDDDNVPTATDVLVVRRDRSSVIAYALGAPWARELAASLHERTSAGTELGRATTGTIPPPRARTNHSPLGKLVHAIRTSLPQPPPGTRVVIVERPHGALVIELAGRGMPALRLRAATDDELAAIAPTRIAIEYARRPGRIGELRVCRRRLLDDPDRVVAAGEPIKCVDRELPRSQLAAAETRRGE